MQSKLSELQERRVSNISQELTTTKKYKHLTYSGLLDKMKRRYALKSTANLRYFICNISQSYNNKTGEFYSSNYTNGRFKFEENLNYYQNKNEEIKLTINEQIEGQYLKNQDRLYGYKVLSKVYYLDYTNQERTKKFITWTLPSIYQKFIMKKNAPKTYERKNFYLNKKYAYNHLEFDEGIELGLKKLSEIERYFANHLNKKISRYIKKVYSMTLKEYEKQHGKKIINKIRVLEPFKQLQGHLHGLYWIDEEFAGIFYSVYKNTIKHFELVDEHQDLQTVTESSAVTYISKYLTKNIKDDEESKDNEYENIANHYRHYFSKIRFFTSSQYNSINQQKIDIIYKFLNKNFSLLLKYYKSLDIPLYYTFEELVKKGIFKFTYEEEQVKSIDYNSLIKLINEEFKEDIEAIKTKDYYKKKIKQLVSKHSSKNIFIPICDDDIGIFNTHEKFYNFLNSKLKEKHDNSKPAFGLYLDEIYKQIDSYISLKNINITKSSIDELLSLTIDDYITTATVKKLTNAKADTRLLNQNLAYKLNEDNKKVSILAKQKEAQYQSFQKAQNYKGMTKQEQQNFNKKYTAKLTPQEILDSSFALKEFLTQIEHYEASHYDIFTSIYEKGNFEAQTVNADYFLAFKESFENEDYEAYYFEKISFDELQNRLQNH